MVGGGFGWSDLPWRRIALTSNIMGTPWIGWLGAALRSFHVSFDVEACLRQQRRTGLIQFIMVLSFLYRVGEVEACVEAVLKIICRGCETSCVETGFKVRKDAEAGLGRLWDKCLALDRFATIDGLVL